MKAMILAAGLGSRLFPLTLDRTKPAVPFLGRPLVGYVAEYLASQGFDDIVVNLHHQAESVRKALRNADQDGLSISFSEEFPKILGTAGAFRKARNLLGEGSFLAINGKIVTDIDLRPAIEMHERTSALATMVLLPNPRNERFTRVLSDGQNLLGFGGFPKDDDEDSLLWTGIHILSPKVFDYIPEGEQDIVSCLYRPALESGQKLSTFVAEGLWNEMSTIERYLDASIAHLGSTSSFIGTDCSIDSSASLAGVVVWDRVTIGADTSLSRVVVTDDAVIPAGAVYSDCAIVSAETLNRHGAPPEKAPPGFFDQGLYIVPLEKTDDR